MTKSWKTTLSGFLAALGVLIGPARAWLDTGAIDAGTLVQVLMVVLGLLGVGTFARDNKVTSEQAGAK